MMVSGKVRRAAAWVAPALLALGTLAFILAAARPQDQERDEGKDRLISPTRKVLDRVGSAIVRVVAQGKLARDGAAGKEEISSGTGFVVNANGYYVVTNHHVLFPPKHRWDPGEILIHQPGKSFRTDDEDRKRVMIDDQGSEFALPRELRVEFRGLHFLAVSAELISFDEPSDLAVLKFDEHLAFDTLRTKSVLDRNLGHNGVRLPALEFAERYAIGDDVIAVGFARSIDGFPTVTKGIISAVGRSVEGGQLSGLIQTDAVLNRGNSGGPLLDMEGRVVGINVGGLSAQLLPDDRIDVVEGIYYARSSHNTEPLVAKMISGERIRRASLGVETDTVTQEMTYKYGFPSLGAVVKTWHLGVSYNQLAYGDVIVRITPSSDLGVDSIPDRFGYYIFNKGDLADALAQIAPDTNVFVEYYRPDSSTVIAYQTESPLPSVTRNRPNTLPEPRKVRMRTLPPSPNRGSLPR